MLAIRPPEYFPGLAYMALVVHVDRFVLADTFQYSKRSMQNRGKLRTPQGWQWISVPLKGGQHKRPIAEVAIETRERWIEKHWRAFQYNYRTTPYFEFYEPRFAPFFEREWKHLGALTCASVELLHELMEGSTELVRASELEGQPDTLPAIWEAVGGGTVGALPDTAAHDAQLVPSLKALHFEAPTYRQNFEGFEPEMSTADLLFNYGPEATAMLREGIAVEAEAS